MPLPSSTPRRVGPYELLRLIGTGGTGAVHLARRADGILEQRVAVKLLRPGSASPSQIESLARERQVQANLEHPGIARLIDGGTTGDGLPYLVLEYVDGVPINAWCDENRLPVRARVELFVQVCAAVDHAHQRLVVHRDLKPANVFVTTGGRPKLLDFGVAKVLDQEKLAASADLTLETVTFLSPSYASPEQLRGRTITDASDQYSLGVMLYELLTGRLPHELEARSPAEIARIVADEDAPRASRVVGGADAEAVARRRDTTPGRLTRELAGDLERVLARAIAPEPMRRYPSVRALAEDLERYLAGRPVEARAPSRLHRATRFVARHKLVAALALLSLVTLAVTLDRSLLSLARAEGAERVALEDRRSAEERLGELQELSTRLITELFNAVIGLPDGERAAELVMQTGTRYLAEVEAQGQADGRMLRLLSQANHDMADIVRHKGAPAAEVEALVARALEFAERMWRAEPSTIEAAAAYARAAAAYADQLVAYRPVLGVLDLAGERLESVDQRGFVGPALAARLKLAEVRYRSLMHLDRPDEAATACRGALELLDSEREVPVQLRLMLEGERARLESCLAHALIGTGEPAEALDHLERAAGRLQQVAGAHAPNRFVEDDRRFIEDLRVRALLDLGRASEADARLRASPEASIADVAGHLARAETAIALQRRDDARTALDDARAAIDPSVAPGSRHYLRMTAASDLLTCARLELELGSQDGARARLEEALVVAGALLNEVPESVRLLLLHGEALIARAELDETAEGARLDFARETLTKLARVSDVETPRMRDLAARLAALEATR